MAKKQTGQADAKKTVKDVPAPTKANAPADKTAADKAPKAAAKRAPAVKAPAKAATKAEAPEAATEGAPEAPKPRQKVPLPKAEPSSDQGDEVGELEARESFGFPVVGVCASAGGLEAFQAFLKALPAKTGAAFVLVQHMDPHHRSTLPEILEKNCVMPLAEVRDGLRLEPDHVYVGVANAIIDFKDGCFKLAEPSNAQHRYRALDVFLDSLARAAGSKAIGVVLSGTGSDGTQGLQAIKEHAGITFGQDPDTARYGAMPLNAYRAGNVDFQSRPEGIAREILRIARNPFVSPKAVPEQPIDDEAIVGQIFALLRNVTRVDFSGYKSNTVRRRITRRMVLRNSGSLDQYLKYLRANSDEVAALYNDLLIKVTEFFRDTEAFQALRKTLRSALKNRPNNKPIRVWVPGCASGEEAYSVAMLLLELREELGKSFSIQVFGTDLSEQAVARAREGRYDGAISTSMDPQRLERFFTKADGQFRVNKPVRELCIFSVHNVVQDPPFSRIDLITCRNLLIYLRTPSQERVLAAFHYGLVEDGHLMLGNSETLGGLADFFSSVDARQRIYRRRPGSRPVHFTLPHGRMAPEMGEGIDFGRPTSIPEPSLRIEADRYVLRRHGPPGVVINENLDILQIRGDTSRFIMPAPGDASLNLLRMARSGLEVELRAAFHKAKRDGGPVRQPGLRFLADDEWRILDIEIVPLANEGASPQRFLVLFIEKPLPPAPAAIENDGDQEFVPKEVSDQEIMRLREELRDTREHLQAALEETETANEELRTANEEALSSNEELQSTNEELQTAMEELQSTNEELTTVNEEMQNRNRELDTLNSDLENLLQSANLPIVFVGHDLRIRRFTPQAEKLLHLISSDIGRPVGDMQPRIRVEDLAGRIEAVVEDVKPYSAEVLADDDRWYELRITPYRTSDHRIDGAVVMMVDIDQLHRRLEETKILIAASHSIASVARPEDAMHGLLEIIGEGLMWQAGEVWAKGSGGQLELESSWSADPRLTQPLLDAARGMRFDAGSGLPGEAWESKQPLVWPRLQDAASGFARHKEAKAAGVVAGIALPIISGGEPVRVLLFFTDRPSIKRESATLEALAAQLSMAFSRRIAEAEVANKAKELTALNTELKMFTRIVAHDLGSPLRSSRLCLDFVDKTTMPEEQAKKLDRAGATLGMVQQLLDGLLQFSRVEAGSTKPEQISLAQLGSDLQKGLAAHLNATGGRIDVGQELTFRGNSVIMYHVLSNLVSNGLLHGPEDGVPVVSVTATRDAEGIRFRVEDNGPGISEDKMERLFTRRADGTLDQARLGLALSKHLLRRIGGALSVSSQQGRGTIVDVTVPESP